MNWALPVAIVAGILGLVSLVFTILMFRGEKFNPLETKKKKAKAKEKQQEQENLNLARIKTNFISLVNGFIKIYNQAEKEFAAFDINDGISISKLKNKYNDKVDVLLNNSFMEELEYSLLPEYKDLLDDTKYFFTSISPSTWMSNKNVIGLMYKLNDLVDNKIDEGFIVSKEYSINKDEENEDEESKLDKLENEIGKDLL